MKTGESPTEQERQALARQLTMALEMAAGRREATALLHRLMTEEATKPWLPPAEPVVVSFSGGVADCIGSDFPDSVFGDLGPELGRAIRESSLCREEYVLGRKTIRATVIGAGCHSTQLSGSTVYHQNIRFPLKNLPVVDMTHGLFHPQEEPVVLALAGTECSSYQQTIELAQQILAVTKPPILLCLQQDMAKALGQALAAILGERTPILCIDRIRVGEDSYLDIGAPVGPAMPVVVKTLVMGK
jgi:ethanolamine utilization protein EutA